MDIISSVHTDNGVVRDYNKKSCIYACIAGVIVIFMYIALLMICRITPFGDNTWVMYDLKRQYIDFYSYYKRLFEGETGLLYSFETALGSGMTGFFIYYLNNPLFLLFNLFPIDRLPLAVTLVIGITLVLGAVIMAFFIRWYCMSEGMNQAGTGDATCFICIGAAVIWAFSGFLIAHSMNMMWTDVVIMLPIVIYALEKIIRKPQPDIVAALPYMFFIACILLFNYYITYQVLLYAAIWTVLRLAVMREGHPFKKIMRVFIYTLIPVGTDAVVLLPTLFELADSPKDIFKLGLETTGKMLTLTDVFSKSLAFAYDVVQPRFGLPQVYCGILSVILLLLFFFNKSRDEYALRKKVAYSVILIILMASFCIDAVNLFFHALMEPSGHPYRQAPLFVFTVILCCVEYLISRSQCDMSEINGSNVRKERIRRYILTFVTVLIMLIFVMIKRYEYTGMKMISINTFLILSFLSICYVGENIYEEKGKSSLLSKMIIIGVIAATSVELLLNAAYTYPFIALNGEKADSFKAKIDRTYPVTEAIKASDNGFYRMESLTPRQQNEGMMYGYNGVTHYSSAGMTYVRYLLQKCGFNDDALYTHYGHDNTVTMDALLGIKYVISEDESIVHHDYVRIEQGIDTGVYAYRNPYALPIAVYTDNYDLEAITGIDNPQTIDEDPFSLQEDMLGRLRGKESKVFIPLSGEIYEEEGSLKAELTTYKSGEVYMYLDDLMGISQGLAVYKDGELITGYGNLGCYKILNLGYYEKGDKVHIEVTADSDDPYYGEPLFVTEDVDELAVICEDIRLRGVNIRQITSSSIELDVPECQGIVTSIPGEEGWNTDMIRTYGALMYIQEPKEGILKLQFIPKGMKGGAAVSLITVLITLISGMLEHKARIKTERAADEG